MQLYRACGSKREKFITKQTVLPTAAEMGVAGLWRRVCERRGAFWDVCVWVCVHDGAGAHIDIPLAHLLAAGRDKAAAACMLSW